MDRVTIRAIDASCFRAPLDTPVVTSFGRMTNRPAVFVRITDEDGLHGWGEAWCNFPSVGAEHRTRIIDEILAPLAREQVIAKPDDLFIALTARTHILALQSGEAGPFAQTIAALDTAMWDLFARRSKLPLWRMMGGASPALRVYASGINPGGAPKTAERALASGHRALKLKIGFDPQRDGDNLAALRSIAGALPLAADVNQSWGIEDAPARSAALDRYELAWLEEPIPADAPWAAWQRIRATATTPLAAGENIASERAFDRALDAGVLGVVQPDLAKWGGLSIGLPLAARIRAAGLRFCPHYLGGGIGLLASAHLLAAAGGDGLLEIDINPNPLRELCCGAVANVRDGTITLTDEPGLGVEPDLVALERYRVA